jgi:hypothetical protein
LFNRDSKTKTGTDLFVQQNYLSRFSGLFGALSFVLAALVFVLVFVLALLIPDTAEESGVASNR